MAAFFKNVEKVISRVILVSTYLGRYLGGCYLS